jgi:hypothetical protein
MIGSDVDWRAMVIVLMVLAAGVVAVQVIESPNQ